MKIKLFRFCRIDETIETFLCNVLGKFETFIWHYGEKIFKKGNLASNVFSWSPPKVVFQSPLNLDYNGLCANTPMDLLSTEKRLGLKPQTSQESKETRPFK